MERRRPDTDVTTDYDVECTRLSCRPAGGCQAPYTRGTDGRMRANMSWARECMPHSAHTSAYRSQGQQVDRGAASGGDKTYQLSASRNR